MPPVQAAIEKTLLDFIKTTPGAGSNVMTGTDAQKLVTALEKRSAPPSPRRWASKIKATPEYKRLEKSIAEFKKAAESSSLGVWVDRNKNVLYVVGAALVVGTASALYITKTGGAVLNTALDPLKGKEFEVLQIGKLGIKAGLWDFKPDARILGARRREPGLGKRQDRSQVRCAGGGPEDPGGRRRGGGQVRPDQCPADRF